MKRKYLCVLFLLLCTTLLFSKGNGDSEETVNITSEDKLFVLIAADDLDGVKELLQKESPSLNSLSPDGETPLTLAATQGSKEIVLLLLNNLADRNQKNRSGSTPLLLALDKQRHQTAMTLLLWDADVNITDAQGENALIKVIKQDNTELCQKILSIDKNPESAVDAAGNSILHWAVRNKNVEILKMLQEFRLDIQQENASGDSPLSIALKNRDQEVVEKLIELYPLEEIQYNGGNLLHYASLEADMELSLFLLSKSTNLLSQQDQQRRIPLALCFERPKSRNHMELAELLIKEGSEKPEDSPLFYFYDVVSRNRADIDFGGGQQAMHLAAGQDHLGVVPILLENYRAPVDSRDEYGSTPLLNAVRRGYESMVRLLLAKGAEANINDGNGLSTIHYAIRLDNGISLCELLRQEGVNFQHQDNLGNTALHTAIIYDLGIEKIKYLLDKGTNTNIRNKQGNTPLLVSILNENKEAIQILQDQSDIFAMNQQGLSPALLILSMDLEWVDWFFREDIISMTDYMGNSILHYASSFPTHELDGEKIQLLVRKGAQVNRRNSEGKIPLHLAVESLYWETGNLLVHLGADPYSLDNQNQSPLLASFDRGSDFTQSFLTGGENFLNILDNQGNTPLITAIKADYPHLASLLVNLGADSNLKNLQGMTALLLSIEKGYEELFYLLIERGSDIKQGDNSGDSALHYLVKAKESFNETLGEVLIDNGLSPNSPNNQGLTPLHYAAIYKNPYAMEFLKKNGADLESVDSQGFTPVFYSVLENDLTGYRYFKEQGANIKVRDFQGNTLLHAAVVEAMEDNNEELISSLIRDGGDIHGLNAKGDSPLILALTFGPIILDRVLIDLSINQQDNQGNSPLHIALSETGDWRIWNLLISKGANLRIRNGRGLTPFQWGKTLGYSEEQLSSLRPE